jgi:trigger factor
VRPDFLPEIPGLTDHFIGMKKCEEKEFKHRLPESFSNKLLAGKEVSFKVKVLEVKRENLPALDDTFATNISPDLKTLDTLRERIRENMKLDYEQKSRTKYEEKIIETVVGQSKLEIPPLLIDAEVDYLLNEDLQQLQEICSSKEEYEKRLKQIPMDKLREQYRALAEKRVRWNLLVEEIEAKEGIEASDEEIDAEIESMLQETYGEEKEAQSRQLNDPIGRENIRAMVVAHKVVDMLAQIAQTPGRSGRSGKGSRPGIGK